METITITTEFIKLQDLLKFGNLVSTGGEAKLVIAEGFNHALAHPRASMPSSCIFALDELGAGDVRISVTPIGCFGARGKAIVSEWKRG